MNTQRMKQSYVGTQTANLISGGYNSGYKTECEQYDGSAWTEKNDINTARQGAAGIGTTAAANAVGGSIPGGMTGVNESWNGTCWSEVNNVLTAR